MTTPFKGSLRGALLALPALLPFAHAQPPPPADTIDTIERISFSGLRRVPQETVRAELSTKEGDRYDAAALARDLSTLQNSGRFEGVRWAREVGQTGWIVRFTVAERPIQKATTVPARPVPQSEVLDRFQMR